MNADLERTLSELGPEYRAVVGRMTAAFADEPTTQVARPRKILSAPWRWSARIAALLIGALGAAWWFGNGFRGAAGRRSAYVLAYSRDADTVEEMLRTQRADGSWDNDFITRQNAAALRSASSPESRIAYRRAVRYLRSKGLAPLSDAELRARGDYAATVQTSNA